MEVLQHILALVITLGILVTIHEFGHFWVARRCGVRVLRFSVGFGKPLWMRKDRFGTEYAIAAIPLGGYVKMLDEREGSVAPDELHQAFNRKPVGQRIAIVAAGPLANFAFAVLAYWLMFLWGFNALVPTLGEVRPESPAAIANIQSPGEIVGVDGVAVATWQDVGLQLLSRLGDTGDIVLEVAVDKSDTVRHYAIPVYEWLAEIDSPDPISALGLVPRRPAIPPVIGVVAEGEAASRAGLLPNDRVTHVDGQPISTWGEFVGVIQGSAGKRLDVEVLRAGAPLMLALTPGERAASEGAGGFIGVGVAPFDIPDEFIRTIRYDFFSAFSHALDKTWDDTAMTLGAIRKMLEGLISVKNLSGPITIARVASSSISSGVESFLRFLALLSISLGVLNLLPVPVLDGGHLLYYAVELVTGKPLSEKVQMMGMRVGIAMILMLMFVAFYNDLARLWPGG